MAGDKKDQRCEIWFCVRQGLSRQDTREQLRHAHGQSTLFVSQINWWYSRFLADPDRNDSDLCHNPGPRKATPVKVNEVRAVLDRDKRATCRQIACEVGVSNGTAHNILRKKLKLSKKPAKWVPHLLTPAQKLRRITAARASLAMFRRHNRPVHVITGDESWFWVWQLECKQASRQWLGAVEDCPQKVCIEQSTQKAMLILFFDRHGPVFKQWVPNGAGVNKHLYLRVMKGLREAVCRRRPTHQNDWVLLHDNAPAHTATIVVDWLRDNQIERVPHPGYCPDISPCDYWVFAELKKMVGGTCFHSVQEMITSVDAVIQTIPGEKWAAAMERYPE